MGSCVPPLVISQSSSVFPFPPKIQKWQRSGIQFQCDLCVSSIVHLHFLILCCGTPTMTTLLDLCCSIRSTLFPFILSQLLYLPLTCVISPECSRWLKWGQSVEKNGNVPAHCARYPEDIIPEIGTFWIGHAEVPFGQGLCQGNLWPVRVAKLYVPNGHARCVWVKRHCQHWRSDSEVLPSLPCNPILAPNVFVFLGFR